MRARQRSYVSIATLFAFFVLHTNVSCQRFETSDAVGSAFGGGEGVPSQTTPSKVYNDVSERRVRSDWRDMFVTTSIPQDCCKHTSVSTAPRDVRQLTTEYLFKEAVGTKLFGSSSSAYPEFNGKTSIGINDPTLDGVKTADHAMVEVTTSTDLVTFEKK